MNFKQIRIRSKDSNSSIAKKQSTKRKVGFIDKSFLWKGSPIKELTEHLKKTGGRNFSGQITSPRIGGGHKLKYRIIDFDRNKKNVFATVERIEYDPMRTAFIALVKYEDNQLSYIICPKDLKVGDKIISGDKVDINVGNCLLLEHIPIGTLIHNVEDIPGKGPIFARAAGTFVSISGKENDFAIIKLSSGKTRKISIKCKATIGIVSNVEKKDEYIGKAGRNRHRGKRARNSPNNRNPVDHKMGGRTRSKQPSNKTGKVRHGKKTVISKRIRNKRRKIS